MTRTKKIYGFRIGDLVRSWTDRQGNAGGRILKIITLCYCSSFQVVISNGDLYTCEVMMYSEFKEKYLNKN